MTPTDFIGWITVITVTSWRLFLGNSIVIILTMYGVIESLLLKARGNVKINCLSIFMVFSNWFRSSKCETYVGIDPTINKLIEVALKFTVEQVSTGSPLFITQPLQEIQGI